jgi:hypothetical protein
MEAQVMKMIGLAASEYTADRGTTNKATAKPTTDRDGKNRASGRMESMIWSDSFIIGKKVRYIVDRWVHKD